MGTRGLAGVVSTRLVKADDHGDLVGERRRIPAHEHLAYVLERHLQAHALVIRFMASNKRISMHHCAPEYIAN